MFDRLERREPERVSVDPVAVGDMVDENVVMRGLRARLDPCRSLARLHGVGSDALRRLEHHDRLDVIDHVLPHGWEVDPHRHVQPAQVLSGTDAGEQQELRRVEDAGTEEHLTCGVRNAAVGFDPGRPPASVDLDAERECLGEHRELAAAGSGMAEVRDIGGQAPVALAIHGQEACSDHDVVAIR